MGTLMFIVKSEPKFEFKLKWSHNFRPINFQRLFFFFAVISCDADEKAARERSERRRAKFSNADGQQKQVSGAYCSFALRISLLTFSPLSRFISLTKQFIRVLYILGYIFNLSFKKSWKKFVEYFLLLKIVLWRHRFLNWRMNQFLASSRNFWRIVG